MENKHIHWVAVGIMKVSTASPLPKPHEMSFASVEGSTWTTLQWLWIAQSMLEFPFPRHSRKDGPRWIKGFTNASRRHLQDSKDIFLPFYQGWGLGITRSGDFAVAKEPDQRSWEIHQFSDGSRGCQRVNTENINTVQGLLFTGDLS